MPRSNLETKQNKEVVNVDATLVKEATRGLKEKLIEYVFPNLSEENVKKNTILIGSTINF